MRRRWLKWLLRVKTRPEAGSWKYHLIIFSLYFQFRITRTFWQWTTPLFSIYWMWDWTMEFSTHRMSKGLWIMWIPVSLTFNLPEGTFMFRHEHKWVSYCAPELVRAA